MTRIPTVVGVDGARVGKVSGWVALEFGIERARLRLRAGAFRAAFADVLAAHPDAEVIAVDIPVGLVERGARACDLAARERLPGRASTLFLAPPRAAVEAATYAEACALAQRLSGAKISLVGDPRRFTECFNTATSATPSRRPPWRAAFLAGTTTVAARPTAPNLRQPS